MAICFVAMPWGVPFDAYYKVVARGLAQAGMEPVRADDIDRPRAIRDQIGSGIAEAAVCVIDVTGRSVTCMYALGLVHGLGKPMVLLSQNEADLPFDLRFVQHLTYRPGTARWEDMLALQLQTAVRD